MLEAIEAAQDATFVPGGAQSYHARVYAKDAERYGVAGPLGGYWVSVAASCLLQPALGDQVLVSMAGQDGYILAVLVQADASRSEVRVSGNVQLSAAQGTLTVAARDGLKLAGGPALILDGKATRLTADTASVTAESLGIHARTMQSTGDTQHSMWRERHDVAHTYSSVATRLECRAQDRVTRISGHDELAAGSQRIVVQGDWRVRARNADVRARQRASLDAEHVQLG